MQMTLPGLRPRHAQDGVLRRRDPARPGDRRRSSFDVPAERRPEQSRLEVRYSPTLAGALVDALPYLVDYPYGCTEQTLNRFLPTVITQKVLHQHEARPEGDPREADQPQRPGDRRRRRAGQAVEAASSATRSSTRPRSRKMAAGRRPAADRHAALRRRLGLVLRLRRASPRRTPRPSSSTACRSPARTTSRCPQGMLERGVAWLTSYQAEQVQPAQERRQQDQAVQGVRRQPRRPRLHGPRRRRRPQRRHARLPLPRPHPPVRLRQGHVRPGPARSSASKRQAGDDPARTSASTSSQDDENQTAYLKLPNEGYWWYWYGSEIEADAYYLKLLARDRPQGRAGPAAGQVPAQQPQARAPTGTRPATRPSASRPWPTT